MAVPSSALKDLVKLPVAAEWRQLGVQLGVPIHTLDEIQANHEHSPNFAQECLSDMFTWWLNNGHDVTYERLECGLRDIGETRMAKQFHQLHSNSSGEQIRIIFNNTCREAVVCIILPERDCSLELPTYFNNLWSKPQTLLLLLIKCIHV